MSYINSFNEVSFGAINTILLTLNMAMINAAGNRDVAIFTGFCAVLSGLSTTNIAIKDWYERRNNPDSNPGLKISPPA